MKPMTSLFEQLSDIFPSLIPLKGKAPIEDGWQYWCENSRLFDKTDFNGHNAGIPGGPANGVIILDIDHQEKFNAWLKKMGHELPNDTRMHLTGSGGKHFFYQYPKNGARYGNRSLKSDGFDIKGIGGQVVAPGSIHPDTQKPYKVGFALPIAPAPQWLLDLALNEGTQSEKVCENHTSAFNIDALPYPIKSLIRNGEAKGRRSEAIASVLAALIKAKVSDKVIFEIFNTYPIGDKYRGKGQGKERWLQAEINRMRGFVNKNEKKKPRGVSLGMAKKQFEHDKDIEFIWREVIPKSMPIMLAGREGAGKTSNALQIAKEIVNGNDTGYVVWLATEGAVLDTIDKADKLGLDNPRFVFAEKADGTYKFEFSRYEDRKELDTLLDELPGPILAVFIDSIRGMSKYGDSDDENGRIMHNLNSIVCDKHKAALIYHDHHKKGAASTLLDKTAGSTSKTSAVRLVLAIEQKSKLVRTIKPAKVNIFKEIPELESIQVGHEIHIRELTNLTDPSMTDNCEMWLTELMSENKEMFAADVYRLAEEKGYSEGILKKAKKELPIKTYQHEKRWKWLWELSE